MAKTKRNSSFRGPAAVFALMAVLISLQGDSAKAQAVAVAKATLGPFTKTFLKLAGDTAAKKLFEELGLAEDDKLEEALDELKLDIGDLKSDIEAVNKLVKDNRYKASLAAAERWATEIDTRAGVFERLEADRRVLSHDSVYEFQSALENAVKQLEQSVSDQEYGAIAALMRTGRTAPVSDLHDYWARIDDLRTTLAQTLVQGFVTYQGTAQRLQERYDKRCGETVVAPAEVTIDYVGSSNTACRAGTQGQGHPKDPKAQGTSNFYFDVHTLRPAACEDKCDRGNRGGVIRCTGFEHHGKSNRCEIWKVPINYIQPSSYGYACYRAKKKEAPPRLSENDECGEQNPRISEASTQVVLENVKQGIKDMYALGVPLLEARNGAKFVHVKDKPWALGPPTRGSGYFATFDREPDEKKLTDLKSSWGKSSRDGKSLEQFLKDNRVPTTFVDQTTWKCTSHELVTGEHSGGIPDAFYEALEVKAHFVSGNSLTSKTIAISWAEEDKWQCEGRMRSYKQTAGQEYRIGSDGRLTGGLAVDSYWEFEQDCGGFFDPCGPWPRKKSFNGRYFGRFFTYNLTAQDVARVCRLRGARSMECLSASPTRLDPGGRAALRSAAAVDAYLTGP